MAKGRYGDRVTTDVPSPLLPRRHPMTKHNILIVDTDVPLLQALAIGVRSGGHEQECQ